MPPTPRDPTSAGNRGSGMVMKANGGKRYHLGQWPTVAAPARSTCIGAIAGERQPARGRRPRSRRTATPTEGRCLSFR